ncbi:MAG: hypothetical protein HC895_01820 [Leptolyngbyaceae cyanobacterium SM1_3_5]|nr:hypothetical protein [Leptolyngbyaceae cyanobacterium SM1_3_5]
MLRFSAETVEKGQIDLSEGGNPYFSIDGGQTSLALFATGVNGDGDQASHWKSQGGSSGLMEPDIELAEQRMISSFDRRALDAIGWDLGAGQYDLDALQQQAKQALADRLGQSIEWLEANPETAAAQLSQDRTADVEEMITQAKSTTGGAVGVVAVQATGRKLI